MKADAGEPEEFFWAELVARTIHPVQVQIVEALLWIGPPLSAADLCRVFEGTTTPVATLHHLERLSRLGILAVDGIERVRGAPVRIYRFAREKEEGRDARSA